MPVDVFVFAQDVHLQKKVVVIAGSLILVLPISRLQIDYDKLIIEAIP